MGFLDWRLLDYNDDDMTSTKNINIERILLQL